MAASRDQIKNVLNVLRRMPPKDVEQDMVRVLCLADPELEDEICQRVDLPLKVEKDSGNGKDFITCDYNRDGDSHRSPWSNEYFPPIEDGLAPAGTLRKLEQKFNSVFDVYRRQYFETGVSSVYLWDLSDSNNRELQHFAGAFLVHKELDEKVDEGQVKGGWNSIHVIEATKKNNQSEYSYKLTSTVLVDLVITNEELGTVQLSGSTSELREKSGSVDPKEEIQSHISSIGPMIEETEVELRNAIEQIYFSKTNSVLSGMRTIDTNQRDVRDKMANIAKGMRK